MKYGIFWAVAALVALTACNKEDENHVAPSHIPAKASLECTLKVATEALNSFDFFVKYYDAEGNIKSEKVVWKDSPNNLKFDDLIQPAKEWTKTVTTTKFPSTLGLFFEVKPKEGIDTNGAYKWIWSDKLNLLVTNENNGVICNPNYASVSPFSVSEGKLGTVFERGSGILVDNIYIIQSDGTVSTRQWQ